MAILKVTSFLMVIVLPLVLNGKSKSALVHPKSKVTPLFCVSVTWAFDKFKARFLSLL